MKPRIRMRDGQWFVLPYQCNFAEVSDYDWEAHVAAYNFCIMLNNRK